MVSPNSEDILYDNYSAALKKRAMLLPVLFMKSSKTQLVVGFSGIFRTGYPTGIETGTRVATGIWFNFGKIHSVSLNRSTQTFYYVKRKWIYI